MREGNNGEYSGVCRRPRVVDGEAEGLWVQDGTKGRWVWIGIGRPGTCDGRVVLSLCVASLSD